MITGPVEKIAGRRRGESGIVLVFLMILILAMLSLAGLVMDIGRVLGVTRQAQNAADVASLAAANQFRTYKSPVQWRKAKKAALTSLKLSQLWGCDADCRSALSAETFYMDDGTLTACDDDLYNTDTGTFGNLTVRLTRGLVCYEGSTRHFVSLEPEQGYCHANAARIELTLADISTTFGQMMGIHDMDTYVTAFAYLTTDAPSCTIPTCASFGITDINVPDPSNCACPCPVNTLGFPACCSTCNAVDCPIPFTEQADPAIDNYMEANTEWDCFDYNNGFGGPSAPNILCPNNCI